MIRQRDKKRDDCRLKVSQTSRESFVTTQASNGAKTELTNDQRPSQMTTRSDSGRVFTCDQDLDSADAAKKTMEQLEMDFDNIYEDLLEDIRLLGDIRVNSATDLLNFTDFCRINKVIKKNSHPTMVSALKSLIDQRRALMDVNADKYRELALSFIEFEAIFTQRVSDVVLESFGIQQQTFLESYQGIQDEQNQEVFASQENQTFQTIVNKRRRLAQVLNRPDLAPRELSEAETYEAFDFEITLRKNCIVVLEKAMVRSLEHLKEEDAIQRCLLMDRMWQHLRIE